MNAWLVYAAALALITGFSVLASRCISALEARRVYPPRPVVPLLSDDRPLLTLVQNAPAVYPDGTRDEMTRSLDVFADLAAAPSLPDDAA